MTRTPPILDREKSRTVDTIAIEQLKMPGVILMENAGRCAADLLSSLGISGSIVIACGKGNNAGDGFVLARHLFLRGFEPQIWMCSPQERVQGDARANLDILNAADITIRSFDDASQTEFDRELSSAHWAVDALWGTGAKGTPRSPFRECLQSMNSAPCQRLALDVPSGLDCDTGQASEDTFRAHHTITFFANKVGLLKDSASRFVGKVHVADIGLPAKWLPSSVF